MTTMHDEATPLDLVALLAARQGLNPAAGCVDTWSGFDWTVGEGRPGQMASRIIELGPPGSSPLATDARAEPRATTFRLALPGLVVGSTLLVVSGPRLLDDAFISMRYAANIADGAGLVFNAGERVEGYSNPLWTLILSAARLLGLDAPWTAVALGALLFLATVPLAVALARRLGGGDHAAIAVGVVVGASTSMAAASTNGLETALFAFGLAGSLVALTGDINPPLATAALLIVAFARPEGPVLVAVLVATTVATRKRWGLNTKGFGPTTIAVTAAIALGLAARLAYYGEVLPMSAIAKRDLDVDPMTALARNLDGGLDYLERSLGTMWILVILATVAAVAFRWRPPTVQARATVALITVASVLGVGVVLSNGGDWMPYARLFVPYLAPILAVLVVGVDALPRRIPVVAWAAVIIAVQPWGAFAAGRWRPMHSAYDTLGATIAAHLPRDEAVTTNVLGRLGYAAPRMRLFDAFGLTEPSVAKLKLPSNYFGKNGTAVAAKRDNAVIVMNDWRFLVAIVNASDARYVAVVGPKLLENNVFLVVRTDEQERFATAITESFGGTFVSMDEAIVRWKVEAPDGFGGEGGP